jgi:transcription-repair coupling factor (superfamily II helicase)
LEGSLSQPSPSSFASSLFEKIRHCSLRGQAPLDVFGLNISEWVYFFLKQLDRSPTPLDHKLHLFICPTLEQCEEVFELLRNSSLIQCVLYHGIESSPYHSQFASEIDLVYRLSTLSKLSQDALDKTTVVITTPQALVLKQVEFDFFKNHHFFLSVGDILSPDDLAKNLRNLGYSSSTSVEEPGTFCRKGEIFDVYPLNFSPLRIHYFDDMIEHIFAIDLATQKTTKETQFESVTFYPAPMIFSQAPFAHKLRENIPMPQPQFKSRFEARKRMMAQLQDGMLFENAFLYTPYFFDNPQTLLGFSKKHTPLITLLDSRESTQVLIETKELLRSDFDQLKLDVSSDILVNEPESFYDFKGFDQLLEQYHLRVNKLNISVSLDDSIASVAEVKLEPLSSFFPTRLMESASKKDYAIKCLQFIKDSFDYSGNIDFLYKNEASATEFTKLLDYLEFPAKLRARISYTPFRLSNSFYYQSEKFLALSDSEFFGFKRPKAGKSKSQKVDLFAEQLATLKKGDYVIHQDHGLGEYLGLESFDFGGTTSDYLVVNYAGGDKVYVPVYKLNVITKHADSTAGLKPENLRSNKFQTAKARAKNSAKKLAFDLLKLQADRQSSQAYSFSPPDDYFYEFERAFKFEETPDQLQAIENVLDHMQRSYPMDHLVCGDVGFGKTEVAMRAAFKAVVDHKQVAVLVPTTILAFQHFNSFTDRFSNFPVKIEFISRFKSAKEVAEIKKRAAAGDVDILIGTHKILSDSLKFKDLGLVVVDEEQRFGVGHKEKLKLLKSSVDFLTLTATPIPRTLQMAFLGIRDLSLIQTAPPRRQSIKTYLIKEDDLTLQSAIRKEIARGGQVFIVHNRVNDMEDYVGYIRELVPEAKIIFAHGQMAEKDLETRMKDFYEGKFNVLVSTTIIESGIDIPNANTMIIDRADTYGLSQLHQLRGRIGRSDKKAYAYFVIPKNKLLTPEAEKRLQALQLYSEIGSGFQIATSDLEIRGAGDILGPDQSGHLDAIGLELYMELLKEAIHEIKGEKRLIKRNVEISTPDPAYIPATYITDSGIRLKTYKRLSNCEKIEELSDIHSELSDVYGAPPEEFTNLLAVLEARLVLAPMGVKSVQVAGKVIVVGFEKSLLESDQELRNRVVEFFISRPKVYQFSPDFKVTYSHKETVSLSTLVSFAKDIALQILPC